ncbi:MAG: penicillin-binding protein 2 [Bacillota bacterium]
MLGEGKLEETKYPLAFKLLWRAVFMIFLILCGRLWFLQIIQGRELDVLSKNNSQRKMPVPAPRGIIYDRDGQILVSNRRAHSVQIIPGDLDPASKRIFISLLGITSEELDAGIRKYFKNGGSPNSPFILDNDIPPDKVIKLEEAMPEMRGVRIRESYVRYYPFGEYGAHLFGYLGLIDKKRLSEQREKGRYYRYDDVIGMVGLEEMYEPYLKGEDGYIIYEIDASKKNAHLLSEEEPVRGDDLNLTIDLAAQLTAEQALREHLRFLQKDLSVRSAQSGAVLALDPQNGKILAMASFPSFDPNNFVSHVPRDWYRALSNDPLRPFINRVLQAYPPGSTFKPVTVLAALEENKTDLKDVFYCSGYDPVYGGKKKCWTASQGKPPHGSENIVAALKNSCNIVFYELGRRVGIDKLASYARKLGFGTATGFEFYPVEKNGLIPDREFKKKNYRRSDMALWYPIETLDVAIGQGAVSATPLQMAQLFMAVANRGLEYRPYVVEEIRRNGKIIRKLGPELRREVKMKESNWETVEKGLVAVTSPGGTAAGAFYGAPYQAAGKTGTAQNSAGPSHGWFVGYAPVENPRILVVVLVEHGGSGSVAAAPIARRVMDAYLRINPTPQPNSPESQSLPSNASTSAIQTGGD